MPRRSASLRFGAAPLVRAWPISTWGRAQTEGAAHSGFRVGRRGIASPHIGRRSRSDGSQVHDSSDLQDDTSGGEAGAMGVKFTIVLDLQDGSSGGEAGAMGVKFRLKLCIR